MSLLATHHTPQINALILNVFREMKIIQNWFCRVRQFFFYFILFYGQHVTSYCNLKTIKEEKKKKTAFRRVEVECTTNKNKSIGKHLANYY